MLLLAATPSVSGTFYLQSAQNITEETFSEQGLFITSVSRSVSCNFGRDRYFAFTLEAVEAS